MGSWDSMLGSGKIFCKTLDAITWKADCVLTQLVTLMEEIGKQDITALCCLLLAAFGKVFDKRTLQSIDYFVSKSEKE